MELRLQGRLNWNSYVELLPELEAFRTSGSKLLRLNFEAIERAYIGFMLPLISEMTFMRAKEGVKVQAIGPMNYDLVEVFKANGWLHALDADQWHEQAGGELARSLPVLKFSDEDQLNNAVSRTVKVCMSQLELGAGVPQALEWVLGELAGNVLAHAETDCGWIQVVTFRERHRLSLVISDRGIGVPASMRSKFKFERDQDAIEGALQQGVTTKPDYGQGNGLAGAVSIAQKNQGYFSIQSAGGVVRVSDGKLSSRNSSSQHHGTTIEMSFSTDRAINVAEALWGHAPTSIIETEFESEAGELVFSLKDYSRSFGSRATGERVRHLIENLRKNAPGAVISVDFKDIGVVGSSFADECFGKLFAQLGAVEFSRSFRFLKLSSLCRSLIDWAILQRAHHTFEMRRETIAPSERVDDQQSAELSLSNPDEEGL